MDASLDQWVCWLTGCDVPVKWKGWTKMWVCVSRAGVSCQGYCLSCTPPLTFTLALKCIGRALGFLVTRSSEQHPSLSL